MSNKTATITRRSKRVGIGVNTSPTQVWNDDYSNSHLYIKKPTAPDFEGTLRQVFKYIETNPFFPSLRSGGTYYSSAFFINGQMIDTESEAWQYELDRLMTGEIDSLVIPLVEA